MTPLSNGLQKYNYFYLYNNFINYFLNRFRVAGFSNKIQSDMIIFVWLKILFYRWHNSGKTFIIITKKISFILISA